MPTICRNTTTKKADVQEYPQAFLHVGVLINEPPEPGPRPAAVLFIKASDELNSSARRPTQLASPLH